MANEVMMSGIEEASAAGAYVGFEGKVETTMGQSTPHWPEPDQWGRTRISFAGHRPLA